MFVTGDERSEPESRVTPAALSPGARISMSACDVMRFRGAALRLCRLRPSPPLQSRETLSMICTVAWATGTSEPPCRCCAAHSSRRSGFSSKNAVERDRRTGVGQILATTPISKVQYTIGKDAQQLRSARRNDGHRRLRRVVAVPACRGSSIQRTGDVQSFIPLTLPTLFLTSAVAV